MSLPPPPPVPGLRRQSAPATADLSKRLRCRYCEDKNCADRKCPSCGEDVCRECANHAGDCPDCQLSSFMGGADSNPKRQISMLPDFVMKFLGPRKSIIPGGANPGDKSQTPAKNIFGMFRRGSADRTPARSLNFNEGGEDANDAGESTTELLNKTLAELEKYKQAHDELLKANAELKKRAGPPAKPSSSSSSSAPASAAPSPTEEELKEARQHVLDLQLQVANAKAEIQDLAIRLQQAEQREMVAGPFVGSGGDQAPTGAGARSQVPMPPPLPGTAEAEQMLVAIANGTYQGPAISASASLQAPVPAAPKVTITADGKVRSEIPWPPLLPGEAPRPAQAGGGGGGEGVAAGLAAAAQPRRGSAPAVMVTAPHMVKKTTYFKSKHASQGDLRPLYWNTVQSVEGTIWSKLPDKPPVAPEAIEKHLADLAQRFAKKPTGATPSKAAAATPVQVQRPKLLDPNRQQKVGIGLASFKTYTPAQMRKLVLELDKDFLNLEAVQKLLGMIPTPDECKLMDDLRADKIMDQAFLASLSKEESFLLEMGTVPRLRKRLECVAHELRFPALYEAVTARMSEYERAIAAVNNSKKWQTFLHLCLETGNFVNEGSKRAGAWGFTMDSLVKLGEARAGESKFSLMHWVAEVAASTRPELLDLRDEFAPVTEACTTSLEDLKVDFGMLTKAVEQVKREVDDARNNDKIEGSAHFVRRLDAFLVGRALRETEALKGRMAKLEADAEKLVIMHGENPQTTSCQRFFENVLTGVALLAKCNEENMSNKAIEQKNRAQAEGKAAGGVAPSLESKAKALERQVAKDKVSKVLQNKDNTPGNKELEAAMARRRA